MKTPQSKIEQELYQEIVSLVATEAPEGWTIAVLKVSLNGQGCEVQLDYIDSTGHVIWFDTEPEFRELLCRVFRKFHVAAQSEGVAEWSQGALTLSATGVISADFWKSRQVVR